MRAMLADASLARYAGRFVWLELDFDKPENQAFLKRHAVTFTPSFFVLDPATERATASNLGGMTLPELVSFLDRGERGVLAEATTPASRLLARGDELLGRGQNAEAAIAFGGALHTGWTDWVDHDRTIGAYTWALMLSKQSQLCATT